MGYSETYTYCEECSGTGLVNGDIDDVKEMVRNSFWEWKTKSAKKAIILWHKLKVEFYKNYECVPCDRCRGDGSFTHRHWGGEI